MLMSKNHACEDVIIGEVNKVSDELRRIHEKQVANKWHLAHEVDTVDDLGTESF